MMNDSQPATLMRREIYEQSTVLTNLVHNARATLSEVARRAHDCQFAVLAARGSSDNASTYGKYLLEGLTGMPTALAAPSLFTLYHTTPRLKHALVVGVSQSGQSADVVEVLYEARRQGAVTLAITNTDGSPITNAADHVILLGVGLERALAATKTVTAQCTAYALLASLLGGNTELYSALGSIAKHVDYVLNQEQVIASMVIDWLSAERAAILGRGYCYGAVQETALKLKETCYLSAEPYSAADFKHGPLAMIEADYPVMALLNDDVTLPTTLDLVAQVRDRGAKVIGIASNGNAAGLAGITGFALDAPLPVLSTIPFIVAGQLFAMHLATRKGYNPDISRGLSKVTVTI
jgi:glucosamine--fructose-6-phosphate aminotransferase (isomerizing)